MIKGIREYEENQRKKKDKDIVSLQNMELTHEKERKKLHLQNEIEELKSNYNKRLENYEQMLRDKFQQEKSVSLESKGHLIYWLIGN